MLARPARRAQVLGFMGAAGGAGTTTMVLNVATALARQRASVIAVELHPWGSTFAAHTGHQPKTDLGQLFARSLPHLTAADVEPALAHVPPGVALLYGPQGTDEAALTPERVENLIRVLSELAQYVLLDLPHWPSEMGRAAARQADHVTVVFNAERVSAALAQSTVGMLRQWGVGPTHINAVAVRRTDDADANLPELAASVGAEVIGAVPFAADALAEAAGSGRRLVDAAPGHAASTSLIWISNQLISQVGGAQLRVAIIDERADVETLTGLLKACASPRFDVRVFPGFDGALQSMTPGEFDLVFLGFSRAARVGLEQLTILQLSVPDSPILVLLPDEDEEMSVNAMRAGAQDTIVKSRLDAFWLLRAVRHALERQRLVVDLHKRTTALAKCEAVYRKLIAKLLREGQPDPRIV